MARNDFLNSPRVAGQQLSGPPHAPVAAASSDELDEARTNGDFYFYKKVQRIIFISETYFYQLPANTGDFHQARENSNSIMEISKKINRIFVLTFYPLASGTHSV